MNPAKKQFIDWQISYLGKSERSAKSYAGVIAGKLSHYFGINDVFSMPADEFRAKWAKVKETPEFIAENKRGKNMYSCGVKAYLQYLDR